MKKTIGSFIQELESLIPPQSAEAWDQVGLVVSFAQQKLTGVVIGVDLTASLLSEAVASRSNLIILHHPPLFPKGRGLTRLTDDCRPQELSTLLLQAYQSKISIYVAHTNFDRCGVDGMLKLAEDLGAECTGRLWEKPESGETLLKKLVTYVPADHFETVRDALYEVGCGHIGRYDSCGFAQAGLGNYRPLQGAKPFQGKVGELETAEEIRFETLVVTGMEAVAIQALIENHPYEEVAYDLYPVTQAPSRLGMVWGLGYGFVGELKKPVSFGEFVKRVKKVFACDTILTNQFEPKKVSKIAFSPGKGSSFVKSARSHGVDVYITGEVGYHGSLDAARSGFSIFELGHRESEHYFLKTVAAWCKDLEVKYVALDERTQRFI